MALEDVHQDIDAIDDQLAALLVRRQQLTMQAADRKHDTLAAHPIGERQRISSGSPFEATIGFSRAILCGARVLVSGTGPVWPDGTCPDDVGLQARRCFEIIEQALAAAGAGLRDVVRTRMFLTDPAASEPVSAVHGELFGATRPAATMVIVAALLDDRWKVEIEAEAELPA